MVLRFSFGSGVFKNGDYLYQNLMAQLDELEAQAGYRSEYTTYERFQTLIQHVSQQTAQPSGDSD